MISYLSSEALEEVDRAVAFSLGLDALAAGS
jgi:hypothetical protein